MFFQEIRNRQDKFRANRSIFPRNTEDFLNSKWYFIFLKWSKSSLYNFCHKMIFYRSISRNRTFIKDEYKDKLTYRYSVWYAYAYIAHNKKCKIEGQIYSTLSSHYTYTLRAFYDRSFMHFCHFFVLSYFFYIICVWRDINV